MWECYQPIDANDHNDYGSCCCEALKSEPKQQWPSKNRGEADLPLRTMRHSTWNRNDKDASWLKPLNVTPMLKGPYNPIYCHLHYSMCTRFCVSTTWILLKITWHKSHRQLMTLLSREVGIAHITSLCTLKVASSSSGTRLNSVHSWRPNVFGFSKQCFNFSLLNWKLYFKSKAPSILGSKT